jgi:hypothetical protein
VIGLTALANQNDLSEQRITTDIHRLFWAFSLSLSLPLPLPLVYNVASMRRSNLRLLPRPVKTQFKHPAKAIITSEQPALL